MNVYRLLSRYSSEVLRKSIGDAFKWDYFLEIQEGMNKKSTFYPAGLSELLFSGDVFGVLSYHHIAIVAKEQTLIFLG